MSLSRAVYGVVLSLTMLKDISAMSMKIDHLGTEMVEVKKGIATLQKRQLILENNAIMLDKAIQMVRSFSSSITVLISIQQVAEMRKIIETSSFPNRRHVPSQPANV